VDLTAEERFSKLPPSAQQGVVGGNRLSHWTGAGPAAATPGVRESGAQLFRAAPFASLA